MKREGASTLFSMVFHGLFVICLHHFLLLFNCLKWCFVCGFENVLKRGHHCGNLCNDSCLNVYKGGLSFEKIFQCFESLIWEMCYEVC